MTRFFIFGDLHYDKTDDGGRRIEQLLDRAREFGPDFIVSLGDLCPPEDANRWIPERLESVGVPVYYVVGNHDTDSHPLPALLDFLGLERPYYSFERNGVKFIVLSACYMERDGEISPFFARNYKQQRELNRYPLIPPEQLAWLAGELSDGKQYVIFSHHSLVNTFRDRGVCNREEVRALFRGRNVLLCMNGHDHGDDFQVVDGVPYCLVNSATYMWCDNTETLRAKYGYLNGILRYRDALSVCVELGGARLRIIGMESDYLDVTPEDVGMSARIWGGVSVEPRTSSYSIGRG